MKEITVTALRELGPAVNVVDVRQPDEFASGHVPGALSMPLGVVPVRHSELDKSEPVYVICEAGGRSAQACAFLAGLGYDAVNIGGGTGMWRTLGFEIETGGPTF
jgi:rhodanese-related sulfurtransferase